jgi:type II secretory pathway pseudopilin PulG
MPMFRIIKRNQLNIKSSINTKGFTLIEAIIAVIISITILSGLTVLAVKAIKNAKFTEKFADTKVLINQKTTELFNNSTTELNKIPANQTTAGSINPSLPIIGYFDLLNENGCVIKRSQFTFVDPIDPIDPNTKGLRGGLGDIGNGYDTSDTTQLDCSFSTSPSSSLTPKFRRQWAVAKDFPESGDVTFSIVIVAIQTNQIMISTVASKTDGFSLK